MVVNLFKEYLKLTQNILDYSKLNNEMSLHFNMGAGNVIEAMNRFSYIQNLELAVRRTTIIEIFKFVSHSTNDQHRFRELISRVKPHIFDDEKITKWENQFLTLKDQVEKVKVLRNKIYAHKDSNDKTVVNYNFVEIGQLIDNCRNILAEIILEFGWSAQLPWKYNDCCKNEMNGFNFFEGYVDFEVKTSLI